MKPIRPSHKKNNPQWVGGPRSRKTRFMLSFKERVAPLFFALVGKAVVGCQLCGNPLAYNEAIFCGAACCADWECGKRPTLYVGTL